MRKQDRGSPVKKPIVFHLISPNCEYRVISLIGDDTREWKASVEIKSLYGRQIRLTQTETASLDGLITKYLKQPRSCTKQEAIRLAVKELFCPSSKPV